MKNRILAVAALSMTLAACASTQPYGYGSRGGYDGYDRGPVQRCYDCGRVERIEPVYGVRQNSRAGAVLGGIVGAVAAREIPSHGSDGKRNTATVAGAVAGAVAGNAIENKANEQTFDIHVRMDDGRRIIINRNSLPSGVREGAYVRVDGTRITALR